MLWACGPIYQEQRASSHLHIFVWIDSGHGIQLDQVSEVWLLQDSMGTSTGGVNSVALDLPVICQVNWGQGLLPVLAISKQMRCPSRN